MGAVTALLYIADFKSYKVSAVIADSAFSNIKQVVKDYADRSIVPLFLF